ncbi:hypothetical protein GCM10028803_29810 [Larkinella knui]
MRTRHRFNIRTIGVARPAVAVFRRVLMPEEGVLFGYFMQIMVQSHGFFGGVWIRWFLVGFHPVCPSGQGYEGEW